MNGYSFCIITDGKEPEKTLAEIHSIRLLNLKHEIVLVGNVHPILSALGPFFPLSESALFYSQYAGMLADKGRLGAMRNLACDNASFDTIILADDDIRFDKDFAWGLEHCGNDWDVMAVRIQNPDGSRYWDWKMHKDGQDRLLDYSVTWHPDVSLTGGIMVLKRHVIEKVRWNDDKGFYQGEDVEFTNVLKKAGMRIRLNPYCLVTHDADYTQAGDVVVRK